MLLQRRSKYENSTEMAIIATTIKTIIKVKNTNIATLGNLKDLKNSKTFESKNKLILLM